MRRVHGGVVINGLFVVQTFSVINLKNVSLVEESTVSILDFWRVMPGNSAVASLVE